jgi:hypothetical protein
MIVSYIYELAQKLSDVTKQLIYDYSGSYSVLADIPGLLDRIGWAIICKLLFQAKKPQDPASSDADLYGNVMKYASRKNATPSVISSNPPWQ